MILLSILASRSCSEEAKTAWVTEVQEVFFPVHDRHRICVSAMQPGEAEHPPSWSNDIASTMGYPT